MRSCAFAAAVLAFGTSLGGCAATTTTSKVAVDYNRIFAKSRDEVLVTNILRASAREPLQFSTMGAVTGSVRNNGSITVPFTNLIGGGLTISPGVTVNDGINPSVTINPLSDKDFTEGVLKPVPIDTVNFLATEGWDPEYLLTLLVGGVVCSDGTAILNRGVPRNQASEPRKSPHFDDFATMFDSVAGKPIITQKEGIRVAAMSVAAKDAVALLKEGAGAGRKIVPLGQVGNRVQLVVENDAELKLINVKPTTICGTHGTNGPAAPALDNKLLYPIDGMTAKIMPRSLEAVIYYLGETERYGWEGACTQRHADYPWPYYKRNRPWAGEEQFVLFHMEKACGGARVPPSAFLQTRFNGEDYYIIRTQPTPEGAYCNPGVRAWFCDRTLTTLSLLNELIALQTNPSSVAGPTPVVNVGSK